MEIKPTAEAIKIIPAVGGVIVEKIYGPADEGVVKAPHVFTDHEELAKYLFGYFVDVEGELKERAKRA